MDIYLSLSVVAFLACLVVPELLRAKHLNAGTSYISAYLTGPYHLIECAGFVVLAVALSALGFQLQHWAALWCFVGAVGLLLTMLTRAWPWLRGRVHPNWHIAAAGVTFGASWLLELTLSSTGLLLALCALYPAGLGLLVLWRPHARAWQEKYCCALICLWLLAYAVQVV